MCVRRYAAPARGQRRVVAAVYEVVRSARMLRLLGEHRLQQSGRLELVGVLLVGRVEVGRQHQPVEDRGLAVGGVCLGARAVVQLVGVPEESGQRINVGALARRGQPGLAPAPSSTRHPSACVLAETLAGQTKGLSSEAMARAQYTMSQAGSACSARSSGALICSQPNLKQGPVNGGF